jgi:2-oxoglutarate dehydrogenase E2 component (dihydrolipoamide succinyltransferase)
MSKEITVPELGESVVEATVGDWLKKVGDAVQVGDIIVELETDKVDIEVGATMSGTLSEIIQPQGADVRIGDVLGLIDENGRTSAADTPDAADETPAPAPEPSSSAAAPAKEDNRATPVARRMAESEGVDLAAITGTGPGGKVTKQDVAARTTAPESKPAASVTQPPAPPAAKPAAISSSGTAPARPEERVRLSRRRRTIAERLVEAQQTAAILTTFNEVDMGAVMDLRKRRQEAFVAENDIKLGFMSFFVKASVAALRAFPRLNAELNGDEMILKGYYDIGIAVGAEEGLVVPVIRNADRKSFARIEKDIRDFATRAQDGTLTLDDLRGGTFTISNGGVYGSMLSTPILNPPQVGILGLHNIQQRPMAVGGEVVIRPMMYLALSYDHRIVDGREAVQFLVRIKELIEDPEALLLAG